MIDARTTQFLLEAGGGRIKIWDFSPELPGAPEAIRHLSEHGVVCSLAHTRATRAQGRAAVEAGARLVTHLFDVFYHAPEASDPDPDIYAAGLVDYLLVEDRLTCEIIGDGTHVDPMLVEKAFRCKPPLGLVFVTDSNYGAGLPPGRYTLPGDWGQRPGRGAERGGAASGPGHDPGGKRADADRQLPQRDPPVRQGPGGRQPGLVRQPGPPAGAEQGRDQSWATTPT